jgi:FKBP-type peptidyl-prolyl cis-trans isomerase SlyD
VKIQKDAAVSLRIQIAEEAGAGKATPAQKLDYLHGYGNLFAKLEAALAGLEPGGSANVTLAPADGFGERDPALVVRERRERLPGDVAIGSELRMRANDESRQPPVFRVIELSATEATLDGNHPLAGRTVELRCAVLDVREATEEEIAHGHLHGPHDDHSH